MKLPNIHKAAAVLGMSIILTACGSDLAELVGMEPEPNPESPGSVATLSVVSNRADLISGGQALVALQLPADQQGMAPVLNLNGTDISNALVPAGQGMFKALVQGLKMGPNSLKGGTANQMAEVQIVNHSIGGPVFSGPQIQPWNCRLPEAQSANNPKCIVAPSFALFYVPAQGPIVQTLRALPQALQAAAESQSQPQLPPAMLPYDPMNPPAAGDIAQITTETGETLPFIVRRETGYINRDRYQVMAVFKPGEQWTALAPQTQWNRKLLIHHGGNVGVEFGAGNPPNGDIAGTAPGETGALGEAALGNSILVALSRGFVTLSAAQANLGHNVNLVTAAEGLMMAKEQIIETYGELRYTIGTGCSGGAIAQQHISNAYPGIYQGMIVQCSYPDVWTTATQFAEYHGITNYLGISPENPSGPNPMWPVPAQWSFLYGHLPINPIASDLAFFPSARPTQENCRGLPADRQYNRDTNPDGVRCGIVDFMINQFGPQTATISKSNGSTFTREIAGIPIDNIGVQYGLGAFKLGLITAQQFLDVNRNIGGLSVDILPQAERTKANDTALKNSYRTGAVNTADNLAGIPIIDLRGPDPGIAHDAFHSWQMRARLLAKQGHHDNQVIWFGQIVLAGDSTYSTEALFVMDEWLSAIEADASDKALADKVRTAKPRTARDRCLSAQSTTAGNGLIVPFTGNLLFPNPALPIPMLDQLVGTRLPPELGLIVDTATNQVCGLDVSTLTALDPTGQISAALAPVTEQLAAVLGPVASTQNIVVQTRFATPRIVAGDDIRTLTNKCVLKPVAEADYAAIPGLPPLALPGFVGSLKEIFPDGVCDFSKPGVHAEVKAVPWLTYGKEAFKESGPTVIYGGDSLPAVPANSRTGWASPAFELTR